MDRLWGWVRRVLRIAPRERGDAIRLTGPCWKVAGRDLGPVEFLGALRLLVPDGAVLYLEGGCHAPALVRFLEEHGEREGADIPRGTLWPRRLVFRIRVTGEVLRELAGLAARCAAPEFCDHLHVYDREGVILQWYDAFDDPILVSKRLPPERVAAFCGALGRDATDQPASGP